MSSLPAEPLAFDIFSWMKSNFAKLPRFVGGAVDFRAFSSATNFSKILAKSGCTHVEGLKERKEFKSPAEFGESSGNLTKSIRIFMKSFRLKFGRANACSLAVACRAAVH